LMMLSLSQTILIRSLFSHPNFYSANSCFLF
jgi:hypothetical protein